MTALSLLMIIFAYLLGSISSAVLICRLYRLPDPREEGSCNAGATNVLRVCQIAEAGMMNDSVLA